MLRTALRKLPYVSKEKNALDHMLWLKYVPMGRYKLKLSPLKWLLSDSMRRFVRMGWLEVSHDDEKEETFIKWTSASSYKHPKLAKIAEAIKFDHDNRVLAYYSPSKEMSLQYGEDDGEINAFETREDALDFLAWVYDTLCVSERYSVYERPEIRR